MQSFSEYILSQNSIADKIQSNLTLDILIDSMEVMVNASQSKLRDLGTYDVIEVQNKGKKTQILLLADEEYEIIEG